MTFQSSKEITVNVKTPKDKKSIKVGEKATIKEVMLIKTARSLSIILFEIFPVD